MASAPVQFLGLSPIARAWNCPSPTLCHLPKQQRKPLLKLLHLLPAMPKTSICLAVQLMCAYAISMMHLELGKSINSGWGCSRLQWLQCLSQLSFIIAPVCGEQSHSLTQSQSRSSAMFTREVQACLPPSKQLALQIDSQAVVVTSSDFCYVLGKVNFFGLVIVPKAAAAQCTLDTASASMLTSAQVKSFVHAQQEQRRHL